MTARRASAPKKAASLQAAKAAIGCGVLFDHTKHPREPGTECLV